MKDASFPSDSALRKLAGRCSLAFAIVLVVVKLFAWIETDSVALLTSAIDALVDTAAAIVTLLGVTYASRPADREHRFGHGKGEAVAGFTQATFLAGAALALGLQSLQRLVSPQPVSDINIGIWIIAGSLVAALCLVILQSFVVKRTGSTAIKADRAHYLTDVAVNGAVLLSLAVTGLTGSQQADPAFALGIAAYMLVTARGVARAALDQLLDRELPDEERARITATLLQTQGVEGLHDLRTRFSGDRTFIEYHLEVAGTLSVTAGHAICDLAEGRLKELLSGIVQVTTHLEPRGLKDERLDDEIAAIP